MFAPGFIKNPEEIKEITNIPKDLITLNDNKLLDDFVIDKYSNILSTKYNIKILKPDQLLYIRNKQEHVLNINLNQLKKDFGIDVKKSFIFFAICISRRQHSFLIRVSNVKYSVNISVFDSLSMAGPIQTHLTADLCLCSIRESRFKFN
uniref:Uncharacterized protein n=1 Tax=Meloidogyne incognita TaxID=6306 RepID=A0A914LF57_MELIC